MHRHPSPSIRNMKVTHTTRVSILDNRTEESFDGESLYFFFLFFPNLSFPIHSSVEHSSITSHVATSIRNIDTEKFNERTRITRQLSNWSRATVARYSRGKAPLRAVGHDHVRNELESESTCRRFHADLREIKSAETVLPNSRLGRGIRYVVWRARLPRFDGKTQWKRTLDKGAEGEATRYFHAFEGREFEIMRTRTSVVSSTRIYISPGHVYHQISIQQQQITTTTPLYHHCTKDEDDPFGIVFLASCAVDAPRARCQLLRRYNRRWERQPRGHRSCSFSTSSYSSRRKIGHLGLSRCNATRFRFVTHALRTKLRLHLAPPHGGKTCHQRIKSRIRRVRNYHWPRLEMLRLCARRMRVVSSAESIHRRIKIRWNEKAGEEVADNK